MTWYLTNRNNILKKYLSDYNDIQEVKFPISPVSIVYQDRLVLLNDLPLIDLSQKEPQVLAYSAYWYIHQGEYQGSLWLNSKVFPDLIRSSTNLTARLEITKELLTRALRGLLDENITLHRTRALSAQNFSDSLQEDLIAGNS